MDYLRFRKSIEDDQTESLTELKRYITAFRRLDNTVNQFFENYQNVPRSSNNIATIWKAVIAVRTQMINAIVHMQDEERFLSGPYKQLRITEMTTHLIPLRQSVSRAVGILTLFVKNMTSDIGIEWHHSSFTFLKKLTEELAGLIFNQTSSWCEFLVDLYEVQGNTKAAYRRHLREENEKLFQQLKQLEAKRSMQQLPKLHKLFDSKYRSLGTKQKLPFLTLLEDIYALIDGMQPIAGEYRRFQKDIRSLCGLQENYAKRDSFVELKAHQQGLTDLGPFGVSPCKDFREIFDAVTEPGVHPDGMKYEGYLELQDRNLQNEFTKVFRFRWYKCNMSELTPIKFSRRVRDALSIPPGATKFAWVFPNIDDTKVALVTDPDQKRMIENYKKGEDAVTCIMATGGFAYFDDAKRFLGVQGIYLFGDDMFFDGPYEFPEDKIPEYFPDESDGALHEMQEVTVPFLREAFGCDKFGWIAEDEELGIDSGAFYYQYIKREDGSRKAPNYFKFLDFEQAKLQKLKNNNTPGIQYLETLYARYKDEWKLEDELEIFRAFSSQHVGGVIEVTADI